MAAALAFLVLAARWLIALRRAALDAKLALTLLDKLLAAAPIGYTVFCFLAAGVLADGLDVIARSQVSTARLPLFGEVERATALWVVGLLMGLAIATPPIVVFTVESYFDARLPELVTLGRRAVWSLLTGVKSRGSTREVPSQEEEDLRWKKLLM